jgi:tripartite-type tricarboxylate transporter receptor subunit TctC
VQALLGGEVPVLVDTPTPIKTFVDDGKIKPLSLSTKERWPRWPDTPTVDETVIPGFDVKGWLGVGTVKGVPAPIVARLNQAIRAAAAKPEVTEKLLQFGTAVWTTTPEETQAFVAEDIARWTKVIREAKVPQID